MKMFWFFNATTEIPWAFKLCAIFQMSCDMTLGVLYWMYGEGVSVLKDHAVEMNGSLGGRPPTGEKDARLSQK